MQALLTSFEDEIEVFRYHYTTGDPQLEETVKEMLDSIELSCSSG